MDLYFLFFDAYPINPKALVATKLLRLQNRCPTLVCSRNPERRQTTLPKWSDQGVRPPCSCRLLPSPALSVSCSHLIPPFYSIHPAAAVLFPSPLPLCHKQNKTKPKKKNFLPPLSFPICPGDTKMDGEAPGMGRTKGCATRWAASAAYGPRRCHPRLLRGSSLSAHVCVKGGLSGTVWQQMLLFGQKSEKGPRVGGGGGREEGGVGGDRGLVVSGAAESFFSSLFLRRGRPFSASSAPPSWACRGGWARGNVRAAAWWNT